MGQRRVISAAGDRPDRGCTHAAGDPRGVEAGGDARGVAADLPADELMKILHVVGARPNFMKTASIMHDI